jgi:hypothetical protein
MRADKLEKIVFAPEPEFVNVQGAQDSIPRNRFCQPIPTLFLAPIDCLKIPMPEFIYPVLEIIDPVFAKTSPKRSFSMTEYERIGLVFTKTRVYKFGHSFRGNKPKTLVFSTSNRVVKHRQAGNRFLGFLKGFQIRALSISPARLP